MGKNRARQLGTAWGKTDGYRMKAEQYEDRRTLLLWFIKIMLIGKEMEKALKEGKDSISIPVKDLDEKANQVLDYMKQHMSGE